MGENTKIAWADHTFNPWEGCQRVSRGCVHCYAEARDHRFTGGVHWGPGGTRRKTVPANWAKPRRWNREAQAAGRRYRVFSASLADVYEDRAELAPWRLELLELIRTTPALDWLVLTKRPQNVLPMLRAARDMALAQRSPPALLEWLEAWLDGRPPANYWQGATMEGQAEANERAPLLLEIPAVVHFASLEPLVEPVDLVEALSHVPGYTPSFAGSHTLDWAIIGGESGDRARPFELDWARSLLRDCERLTVVPFVKQLGARASDARNGIAGALLEVHPDAAALISRRLADPAGADLAEWPADLRVQHFPDEPGALR